MHVIGQENTIKHFTGLIDDNKMPRVLIIEGDKGQGKRTITKYIAEYMDIDVYEPDNLKVDDIRKIVDDSQSLSRDRLYALYDADEMTTQAQNAILKFLEEPQENAYIIITVQEQNYLLDTIISRATMIRLEQYTHEQLKQAYDNEKLCLMFNNPGQIETAIHADNFEDLHGVIKTFVDNAHILSAKNTFKVPKYFEGYDNMFIIDIMLYELYEKIRTGGDVQRYFKMIYQINNRKHLFHNKSINKANLMEMILIDVRKEAHGGEL